MLANPIVAVVKEMRASQEKKQEAIEARGKLEALII